MSAVAVVRRPRRIASAVLAGIRRACPPVWLAVVVGFRVSIAAVVGAGALVGLSVGWARPRSAIRSADGLKAAAIGFGLLALGWSIVLNLLAQIITAGRARHVVAWAILAAIVAGLAWLGMRKLGWGLLPASTSAPPARLPSGQAAIMDALAKAYPAVAKASADGVQAIRVYPWKPTETGRQCVIETTAGLDSTIIARSASIIAGALDVHADQVTISEGRHARQRTVHIAAIRPADVPAPAWEHIGVREFDLRKPLHIGADIKGGPVRLSFATKAPGGKQTIAGGSLLVAGQPSSGKSWFLRTVVAAAMMDPEATVAIVDLKADGGDFEPFAARADFYHAGMGPGTVEKVAAMLTEAAVRMDSPSRYGRKPLLILIDEAHEIAGHKAIGPLLERLVRSGRAAGIILVLSTQRTSKASIPADITTSMIHRVCLRVGDQPTNDLALGTGAYARGLDATKFTEPGQAWVIGFGSAPVQAKLVSNGADVIEPIAALPREPRPILGASSDPQPEQAPEQAWPIILGDLYDIWPVDHAQQIRQRNAFLDDLAARLAAQWPGRYDGMDRARLRTELRDCGVEPRLKVRVGPDQGPGLAIGDITPPSRNTGPTRTP